MSTFLSPETAAQAVALYEGALVKFMEAQGKKGFHIVILDPEASYAEHSTELCEISPGHILFEKSFNEENWAGSDYRKIAHAKVLLCQRERMNSGDVPRHCLRSCDVIYAGGVYYEGLSVAISGFDSIDDESWSLMIAKRCEMMAFEKFEEWNDKHKRQAFV